MSYVFDYIDVDKSNHSRDFVELENLSLENTKNIVKSNQNQFGNKVDRYNDIFVNYTHCEIHPSLYLGSTSSNIPYAEHNQRA